MMVTIVSGLTLLWTPKKCESCFPSWESNSFQSLWTHRIVLKFAQLSGLGAFSKAKSIREATRPKILTLWSTESERRSRKLTLTSPKASSQVWHLKDWGQRSSGDLVTFVSKTTSLPNILSKFEPNSFSWHWNFIKHTSCPNYQETGLRCSPE